MGLQAFSSQLLCEQVVGRGLRRVRYDIEEAHGLFEPEHVNIFGIPFSFLPHEEAVGTPPPPKPTTKIESIPEKIQHAIAWHECGAHRPRASFGRHRVRLYRL